MAQKKWTSQSEKYSTAFCEYYLPKVVYDPNFNPHKISTENYIGLEHKDKNNSCAILVT